MAVKKKVIIDSSSAILLYKAGLFQKMMKPYSLVIPLGAYNELIIPGYDGADFFMLIKHDRGVSIETVSENVNDLSLDELLHLGQGEKESILLYLQGHGEFILLDDKKGASWCRKKSVPYTNALLAARLLFENHDLNESEYEDAFKALMDIGWYSEKVVEFARGCHPSKLKEFLPLH